MTNSFSRSTKNTSKLLVPAGAVSLREASARDVPNLRTRYRACDHSNPLTIHPPSLFYTTHLHNPPTTLIYHPSHPLSTTTTSPHELHIPERINFKCTYHYFRVGVYTGIPLDMCSIPSCAPSKPPYHPQIHHPHQPINPFQAPKVRDSLLHPSTPPKFNKN